MFDIIIAQLSTFGGPVLIALFTVSVVATSITVFKVLQFARLGVGRHRPAQQAMQRWNSGDTVTAMNIVAHDNAHAVAGAERGDDLARLLSGRRRACPAVGDADGAAIADGDRQEPPRDRGGGAGVADARAARHGHRHDRGVRQGVGGRWRGRSVGARGRHLDRADDDGAGPVGRHPVLLRLGVAREPGGSGARGDGCGDRRRHLRHGP